MTIEQRAVQKYGLTDNPEHALFMLASGQMLNGSYEGRQRDIDHRDISEFFKRSVKEDPGSAYIYVLKFMRRGNIRMTCSGYGYNMELTGVPTGKQLDMIKATARMAEENGIDFCIEKTNPRNPFEHKHMDMVDYLRYLERYNIIVV